MVLTVHYEAADLTEPFLLADREESTHDDDLPIYSPHSPLGTTLTGAGQGNRREYRIPGGETMTLTLVTALPYRRRSSPAPPTQHRVLASTPEASTHAAPAVAPAVPSTVAVSHGHPSFATPDLEFLWFGHVPHLPVVSL
ncbi:hypothetical protein ACVGVM_29835 (plasmid) [Pseudonocardia bannensis]|uniref:hypothetical protein n=1 Tax=Pseudonocardia TaxID=1847 RepID=UPI001FE6B754|nr:MULTISPECIES: hypothetical protein [Pseudonocardia]